MIKLTTDILQKIVHKPVDVNLITELNVYLPQYGIDTLLRLDHFLGQAAEESDGFSSLVEDDGDGRAYEGRRDLGNIHPGDGVRFKGRGIFQLTGRANYTSMSAILGVDLVNHPELAATPEISVRVACEYWKTNGLSALADDDDLEAITKRINGGYNGLEVRRAYTDRVDMALSQLFPKDEQGRIADNKGL